MKESYPSISLKTTRLPEHLEWPWRQTFLRAVWAWGLRTGPQKQVSRVVDVKVSGAELRPAHPNSEAPLLVVDCLKDHGIQRWSIVINATVPWRTAAARPSKWDAWRRRHFRGRSHDLLSAAIVGLGEVLQVAPVPTGVWEGILPVIDGPSEQLRQRLANLYPAVDHEA
jgi:hypothetical protein